MSGANSAAAARRRVKTVATSERAAVSQRFFRTAPGEYGAGDRFLGVTVPDLRMVAREFQSLPQREALRLLSSPWHEERLLALLMRSASSRSSSSSGSTNAATPRAARRSTACTWTTRNA